MPEINELICPTCNEEGQIVTTWSTHNKTDDFVYAQWICDLGHRWQSKSEYCDNIGNYVTVNKEKMNA